MENEIQEFIRGFKRYDRSDVLIKTFLEGYCYYFAVILQERFGGEILYEPIEGHFITKIGCSYYDIRGDVTNLYNASPNLLHKEDWMKRGNIVRGCILKSLD